MEVSRGDEALPAPHPGAGLSCPCSLASPGSRRWPSSLKWAWFEVEHEAATCCNGRQQIWERLWVVAKGGTCTTRHQ